MKKLLPLILLFVCVYMVDASQVTQPRLVIKLLIKHVQNNNEESINYFFRFVKEKHAALTTLSRDEQIQLLKDIPIDEIKFDKDDYATDDEGVQFVVRMIASKKLEFEMEVIDYRQNDLGPPWGYKVIAVRETAENN